MALRFLDSFDHYNDPMTKWTFYPVQGIDASITVTNARNGIQCLKTTRNGVAKTIDNISTWVVGAAHLWDGFSGGIQLLDVANLAVKWESQSDGTIVVSGPGGSIGQTAPADALTLNRYYFIEMKTVLHSSAGSVVMKINGQQVLSVSGKNTSNTNNADVINITGPSGGKFLYTDDLYVLDTTGSNNDFLGDVQIGVIKPNAAGDKSEWVCSSGTVHYSLVNEIPPDNDTSYVSSTMTGTSTTGPSDLYKFETVTSNRIVLGVQSNIVCRKDDEGNRAVTVLASSASTIVQGDAAGRYINLDYIDYLNQYDLDPVGGGTWTPTILNTTQWGVEVVV